MPPRFRVLGSPPIIRSIAGCIVSRIDELPYSVAIHDIGLGGVLVAPQFRRQQEDLAKMASEMISLVERVAIRSTVSQAISLDEIPQSLATLAEGHVRGKIVARM